MKVLSVDIGTVNYAMCAVQYSGTSECDPSAPNALSTTAPVVVQDTVTISVSIIDMFAVDMGRGIKTTKAMDTLITVWPNLVLFQCWQPDIVLIEAQYKGAPTNASLAYCTYTLCRQSFPEASIKFVSPLSKFYGYKRFFPALQSNTKPQLLRTYSQRKKTAIQVTNEILQTQFHVEIHQVFRSEGHECRTSNKLDDVCDAFLQAFCV